MIFSFLKNLFGWADEAPRKRRAVSFSDDNDFVSPKKHCCEYTTTNLEDQPIEVEDDSDDEVEVLDKRNFFPKVSSSRLNGTHGSRDNSFTFCTPPSCLPSSKPQVTRTKSNMGCATEKEQRVQNSGMNHKGLTLTKTHRLRERSQYEELLQNFLPRRIHIIRDKCDQTRPPQEVVEIIDLDKSGSSTPSSKVQQIPKRYDMPSHSRWNMPSKEKASKEKIPITIEDSKRVETSHSIRDITPFCKSNATFANAIQTKRIESVATNTLRDKLAAKIVMRGDYVPQVAKRYDERIEQRNKEAQELKKMTGVLAKHNRLAREAALEEHLARSMRLCEAILDEREEPEEPSLPQLTEPMLEKIRSALIPRPPDEVLVEGFGLRITRKDIHTLANLNWLNDEVINFYMNLLIARSTSNNKYPKVHAMNTFFYPKLVSSGHASLKRWTRKIDIFAQDLIVVPIHLGIHWCMSIIDFRDKSIRYYDSMGSNNPKCLAALKQYLEDESLDKKKKPYDTSGWKLECAKNIPQQMNGSDCGVFSCMFAEYICANKKITFTQENMLYFRNKMVYEILTSKLL